MVTLENIKGLGTLWWFELFDCAPEDKITVQETIAATITAFENSYTRFREDSLTGRLNSGEVLNEPPTELVELLTFGLSWYKKTGGRFNFLTAALQEARGYDQNYSFTEARELPEAPDPKEVLTVSPARVTLTAGKIDLGGFGKGFLIDKLAATIKGLGFEEFLINGGGDMLATHHGGQPVMVHVEHPKTPGKYIAKIPLKDAALANSSSYTRIWPTKNTGRTLSHLIDPENPDKEVSASAHVVAKSAAVADAAATVSCVAPELTPTLDEVSDYLILQNNRVYSASDNFKTWMRQLH